MFASSDVALVRHVVQRILVPCIVVIGLLGNSVSIYVLTRKRMRCTTNIYLTALAITDIAYLTMALLATLQHYEYIQRNSETYYACYGIMMWLIDACAYISIYIAVCFTIERFIAIRYPLKRQTFCTESLAKKVIAGVSLFCLLTTISTAFEHEYRIDTTLIDSHGRPCNLTPLATAYVPTTSMPAPWDSSGIGDDDALTGAYSYGNGSGSGGDGGGGGGDGGRVGTNSDGLELRIGGNGDQLKKPLKLTLVPKMAGDGNIDSLTTPRNATRIDGTQQHDFGYHQHQVIDAASTALGSHIPGMLSAVYPRDGNLEFLLNAEFPNSDVLAMDHSSRGGAETELNTKQPDWTQQIRVHDTLKEIAIGTEVDCKNVTRYKNISSDLGNNDLYITIYYYFTLFIFVLIPLCVLGTFNCFLIMLVRRSKTVRGDLTNASSMRKSTNRKQHTSSVSQENRVTITLIAVVLLFIICQLPWAIYLIVSEQMDIDVSSRIVIGNIFNFLTAINAAANFFLYCVLSDKYRKTVRELITGYRYRKQRLNNNNYNNSSLYTATSNGMSNMSSRRNRQPKPVTSKPSTTLSTLSSLVIE